MTKAGCVPSSPGDDALIVRALYEAAERHLSESDGDRDVGTAMLAALEARHPGYTRARQDADYLLRALQAGYLPPPEGATRESVCDFLRIKRRKRRSPVETKALAVGTETETPHLYQLDGDSAALELLFQIEA